MFLVTGASGLLGANLVLHLKHQGEIVYALYHQHRFAPVGSCAFAIDLNDLVATERLLQRLRPKWIIHCAAQTHVDWCEAHPQQAYQINTVITHNLSKIAKSLGAGLVYISTDSVFDGKKDNYKEEDLPAPLNAYARSKLEGELAVQATLEHSLIVRTNIYGWNFQDKQSLAEWILGRLEASESVPGFEDVVFNPLLVNELSKYLYDMIQQGLTGLFHLGASEVCSKFEFACRLAKVFDFSQDRVHPASIQEVALKALRPLNTSLDVSRICKALNRPMPDLNKGLCQFRQLKESGFVQELKSCKVRMK